MIKYHRASNKTKVTSSRDEYKKILEMQKSKSSKRRKDTDIHAIDNSSRQIPLYYDKRLAASPYMAGEDGRIQIIDVLKYGTWCSNPPESRENIVPLILTEYQPMYSPTASRLVRLYSQLIQFVDSNNKAMTVISNPINNSFIATPTGFIYKFPLLSLFGQSYSTEFGEGENMLASAGINAMDSMQELAYNALKLSKSNLSKDPKTKSNIRGFAGTKLSTVMVGAAQAVAPAINPANPEQAFYKGSSPVNYSITLELSNTISVETALWNKELVELLSHNAGTANLRNAYIGDSPCIYTMEIEGIRWCPACKIDVTFEGMGNLIKVEGEPFPEAYSLTLNISEFYPPLRFVTHAYLEEGIKIRAITDATTSLCELAKDGTNAVKSALGIKTH